jgi:hypothetical protein
MENKDSDNNSENDEGDKEDNNDVSDDDEKSDAGQVTPSKAKSIKEMDKECKVLKGNPQKPYCSAWICNDSMNVMFGHKDIDVCSKYGGVLAQWKNNKKLKTGMWELHHSAQTSRK